MSQAPPDVVEVSLPSHPQFLTLVRGLVEDGAEVAGFSPDERQQIALAVTEGVTNVMRHSYEGRTDGRIDLRLHVPPGLFRLEIRDYGRTIDPGGIRSRPLEEVRPGGLGIHLMKTTMDRVTYQPNDEGGMTLTLVRHARTPDADEDRT